VDEAVVLVESVLGELFEEPDLQGGSS
jgi:hypothetical protein